MASIRKRGETYQVRVIRKGFPAESRTFKTKQEAERWARSVEAAMEQRQYVSNRPAETTLLADLLKRYRETVTPQKRGARDEAIRLRAMERRRLSKLAVAHVTPAEIAKYRDERLIECSPATVIRDLALLSAVLNHAQREWGIGTSNPVLMVRKPPAPQGRDRVLGDAERRRLLEMAQPTGRRSPWLHPILVVALETAMRRGEILSLTWSDVSLDKAVVKLHTTKNGSSRLVPLSRQAVATLSVLRATDTGKVFPISAGALDKMFNRLCQRAHIVDFRFHDLRHTAVTHLAEKLPNVIELAAVTGHRSIQMLKRYYHPCAEELALKLD